MYRDWFWFDKTYQGTDFGNSSSGAIDQYAVHIDINILQMNIERKVLVQV